MESFAIVILVIGLAALIAGIVFFAKSRSSASGSVEQAERLVQNLNTQIQEQTARLVESIALVREDNKTAIGDRFSETQKGLAESLSMGRRELSESMSKSQKFLADKLESLIKETADIRSASNNMLEIGRDIKQLSSILENPKSRGGFGEFQLEMMLRNAIPADRYRIQYKIGSVMADAALLLKDSVLCIDSKFPQSNLDKYYKSEDGAEQSGKLLKEFYKDVKNRAREIRDRYISPPATLDFAIMFVPSESVFLEIVQNRELHEKLLEMRVIPASPNFLYVYFQALAIGFRGMAVEERAAEIIKAITDLEVRFENFNDVFRVLGGHLENAQKKYGESEKQLGKLQTSLDGIQMGKTLAKADHLAGGGDSLAQE